MEDIPRNLAKDIEKLTIPRSTKRAKSWDILFVDGSGDVIMVRWFKALAILSTFILTVVVIAGISTLIIYKSASNKNKKLQDTLTASQHRNMSLKDEKDVLMARLVIAESRLKQGKTGSKKVKKAKEPVRKPKTVIATAKTKPEPAVIEKKVPVVEKETTIKLPPLKTEKSQSIGVNEFNAFSEPGTNVVRVQFKLINTGDKTKPVSGHAFVILKQKDAGEDKYLTLPKVVLTAGKPSNTKRGQYFSIFRYKTVKFKAVEESDPARFNDALVLVYTTSGDLLLEKDFSIEVKSEMAPVTEE